ncbi:MAG: hypothetical protein KDK35_07925 [Leptospiraceae bacterium]|nr:hypothetical protein [Leptospiraceae bacterium]
MYRAGIETGLAGGLVLKSTFTFVFTVLIAAAGMLSVLRCDRSGTPSQEMAEERPRAQFVAQQAGPDTIQVTVDIPPGHHAYLDSGDRGNLVPISFDWSAVSEVLPATPSLEQVPEGDRDEDVGARVLRGQSRFVFAVPDAQALKGSQIQVTSQICDEEVGLCYRPEQNELTIY